MRALFLLVFYLTAFTVTAAVEGEPEQRINTDEAAVLLALLNNDRNTLTGIFQNAATCEAATFLLAEMPAKPLYQSTAGVCQPVDMNAAQNGNYFSDAACTQSVTFHPTTFKQYCQDSLDSQQLGNAALIAGTSQPWTLSPGTRMNIGIETIADKQQPYSTRTAYKTVTTSRGQCSLEMRVYKNDLASSQLKPLLALHGGSWRYRGGFIGIESQIAHFTEKGFIVFAPFYRLSGESEGNSECNNASAADIFLDVTDALAWVQSNSGNYGANSGKIALMGQSAGAHLSAWLAVHHADSVARALLLYPPTDFKHFITQWRNGEIIDSPGIQSLQGFLGEDLSTVDLNSALITENSFPAIVENDPTKIPPLFIIHGSRDELVPASQSARLCNALSGSIENGPAISLHTSTTQSLEQKYICDNRSSELHSITAANHVLDLCLYPVWCPAGNLFSQATTAVTLQQSREWLTLTTKNPDAENNNSSAGGAIAWLLAPLFISFLFLRRKR